RIWWWFAFSCVFSFWFGPSSFRVYRPLPLDSRMALPCAPGILICAAYAISRVRIAIVDRPSFERVAAGALVATVLVIQAPAVVRYVASWQPDPTMAAVTAIKRE